jgi:hypothetical protein
VNDEYVFLAGKFEGSAISDLPADERYFWAYRGFTNISDRRALQGYLAELAHNRRMARLRRWDGR